MMADRMPNASYHYQATVLSWVNPGYGGWEPSSYPKENYSLSDNGVFIQGKDGNEYFGCPRSASRITTVNPNKCTLGGINMNTSDSQTACYKFGMSSNDSNTNIMVIGIYYGNTTPSNTTYVGRVYTGCSLSASPPKGSKLVITADKVEICYKTSDSEIVYMTGISLLATVDGEFYKGSGFIIARSVPISGDGYIAEEEGGSSNGSTLFDSVSGAVIGCFPGTNVSTTSAIIISQSIPDSAMVGNDGICAVSCMCMADGNAAWLSHKNGIYKIYQGPKPLYGMPGDKITIKGHEFVCLAYGPFYARMS